MNRTGIKKDHAPRVYILPTRFGLVFGLLIFIMFITASTYLNNLIYLLTFFALTVYLAALVQTNFNLKGITIDRVTSEGGYAGESQLVGISLCNLNHEAKLMIECSLYDSRMQKRSYLIVPNVSAQSVIANSAYHIPESRGVFQWHKAKLSTVYPLGLWRAWSWVKIEGSFSVYPKRLGDHALPFPRNDLTEFFDQGKLGEDFSEHRYFASGDSYARVDWKALARRRMLMVKKFEDGATGGYVFDWSDLRLNDPEAKLEQLSLWIDRCHRDRQAFILKIPGYQASFGRSGGDLRSCLERLASFDVNAA